MEQRDYIKRQIDRIGVVIGEILRRFHLARMQGGQAEAGEHRQIECFLKTELDLELGEILSLSPHDAVESLADIGFDYDLMNSFNDMLLEMTNMAGSDVPDGMYGRSGKEIREFCRKLNSCIEKKFSIVRFDKL